MTTPTFSIVVNHAPWRPDRVAALAAMKLQLLEDDEQREPLFIHDTDYRDTDWQISKVRWALDQWEWSLRQPTTHHVFLTDDLHLAPHFRDVLTAMVMGRPTTPIGLVSNHPRGPELYADGHHGYCTDSWITGPAYVMPHAQLAAFVAWFADLPDGPSTLEGTKSYRNDDSSINEWITRHGKRRAWHPLPTIVEHRADLESTVGHGDRYSRERLSWRERRRVVDVGADFRWVSESYMAPRLEDMLRTDFWMTDAPMLAVGGE